MYKTNCPLFTFTFIVIIQNAHSFVIEPRRTLCGDYESDSLVKDLQDAMFSLDPEPMPHNICKRHKRDLSNALQESAVKPIDESILSQNQQDSESQIIPGNAETEETTPIQLLSNETKERTEPQPGQTDEIAEESATTELNLQESIKSIDQPTLTTQKFEDSTTNEKDQTDSIPTDTLLPLAISESKETVVEASLNTEGIKEPEETIAEPPLSEPIEPISASINEEVKNVLNTQPHFSAIKETIDTQLPPENEEESPLNISDITTDEYKHDNEELKETEPAFESKVMTTEEFLKSPDIINGETEDESIPIKEEIAEILPVEANELTQTHDVSKNKEPEIADKESLPIEIDNIIPITINESDKTTDELLEENMSINPLLKKSDEVRDPITEETEGKLIMPSLTSETNETQKEQEELNKSEEPTDKSEDKSQDTNIEPFSSEANENMIQVLFNKDEAGEAVTPVLSLSETDESNVELVSDDEEAGVITNTVEPETPIVKQSSFNNEDVEETLIPALSPSETDESNIELVPDNKEAKVITTTAETEDSIGNQSLFNNNSVEETLTLVLYPNETDESNFALVPDDEDAEIIMTINETEDPIANQSSFNNEYTEETSLLVLSPSETDESNFELEPDEEDAEIFTTITETEDPIVNQSEMKATPVFSLSDIDDENYELAFNNEEFEEDNMNEFETEEEILSEFEELTDQCNAEDTEERSVPLLNETGDQSVPNNYEIYGASEEKLSSEINGPNEKSEETISIEPTFKKSDASNNEEIEERITIIEDLEDLTLKLLVKTIEFEEEIEKMTKSYETIESTSGLPNVTELQTSESIIASDIDSTHISEESSIEKPEMELSKANSEANIEDELLYEMTKEFIKDLENTLLDSMDDNDDDNFSEGISSKVENETHGLSNSVVDESNTTNEELPTESTFKEFALDSPSIVEPINQSKESVNEDSENKDEEFLSSKQTLLSDLTSLVNEFERAFEDLDAMANELNEAMEEATKNSLTGQLSLEDISNIANSYNEV